MKRATSKRGEPNRSWGARLIVRVPSAVADGGQDQLVAHGNRPAAVYARLRSCRRLGGSQAGLVRTIVRELRLARFRLALSGFLSQEPGGGGRLDPAAAADRLPARLRNGARPATLAADRVRAGGAAVLDVIPDPHLRLDQHPSTRRPA